MAYIGNQLKAGSYRKLTDISGSFNGVTTTFTTSVPPGTSSYYVTAGSASQLLISLGGVVQQPDTDYTVSTNSITFTTAPAAGLSFFGVLMGDALNIGTPSDGTITDAKVAAGAAIAGTKISPNFGSQNIITTGTNTAASHIPTSNTVPANGLYLPAANNVGLSTNSTSRFNIDSSGYATGTVNGLSSGLYPASQLYRLNSNFAGSNATGAQSLFGVGVTLVGNTVYEFDSYCLLQKTAGVTSHTFGILFGGAATINNINTYINWERSDQSASSAAPVTFSSFDAYSTSTSLLTITSAITSASETITIFIKGTVSINAGGTFIPQYQLSAAPGGAYSTVAGSYFKIAPLGSAGANTSIGSWA